MSASADVSKMLAGLKQRRLEAVRAARRAMDEAGEMIIGNAQQLTPVDTGALQGSGTTEPAQEHAQSILKTIGFNTEYAAAVHERGGKKDALGKFAKDIAMAGIRLRKEKGKQKAERKRARKASKQTGASHLREENLRERVKQKNRKLKEEKKKAGRHRVGQPKFLETAMRHGGPKAIAHIANAVRRVMQAESHGAD